MLPITEEKKKIQAQMYCGCHLSLTKVTCWKLILSVYLSLRPCSFHENNFHDFLIDSLPDKVAVN